MSSELLKALMDSQYGATENPYGIGSIAIGKAAPALYNPYGSTGSNFAYTIGAGLLSGILGGLAKREAANNNAELFKTANLLRTTSPEARSALVEENPRIASYAMQLQEEEAQQKAAMDQYRAQKSFENDLAMKQAGYGAQAKALADQGYLLSPEGSVQPVAGFESPQDRELKKAFLQDPYMTQKGLAAYEQYKNGAAAIPEPSGVAPGQQLATSLAATPQAEASAPNSVKLSPQIDPSRFEQLLSQTGDKTVAGKILDKEMETKTKQDDEFDKKLAEGAEALQQNAQSEQEFRSALQKSGETGGVVGVDTIRSGKLKIMAALGDKEAAKRLEGRANLESLGLVEAGKIRKMFPGQVSDREMQMYLNSSPNVGNTVDQNSALLDKMSRLNLVGAQAQAMLGKAREQGLSYSQAQKVIGQIDKTVPLFIKDASGDLVINPARQSLDIESLDFRNPLASLKAAPVKKNSTAISDSPVILNAPDANSVSLHSTIEAPGSDSTLLNYLSSPPSGAVAGNPLDFAPKESVDNATRAVDMIGTFGNRLAFGYGPQIGGTLEAITGKAKDLVGYGNGQSMAENYSRGKAETQAQLDLAKERVPVASAIAGVAGDLLNPVNKLKPIQAAYKMGRAGGILARGATAVGLNALSGDENKPSSADIGTTSVVLDTAMGTLGAVGKLASTTFKSALGLTRSDYSKVVGQTKRMGTDAVKKASQSLDSGLQLALKENPLSIAASAKSDSDVLLHVIDGAQQGLDKRLGAVNSIIQEADAVRTKAPILATNAKNAMVNAAPSSEKEALANAYDAAVRDWKKWAEKNGGVNLQNLQKEKIARNASYKLDDNTYNMVNKAVADDFRLSIEYNTKDLAKAKLIPEEMAGKVRELNLESRDLLNIQKVIKSKLPGAEHGFGLDDARKMAYTTGGSGAAGIGMMTNWNFPAMFGAAATYLKQVARPLSMVAEPVAKAGQAFLGSPGGRMAIQNLNAPTSGPRFENQYNLPTFESPYQTAVPQSEAPQSPPLAPTGQVGKQDVSSIVQQQHPFIQAIIAAESAGNPQAISKAGASGLMQVMPENLKKLGVSDPSDPIENIRAGTAIISEELNRYKDPRLALAAYNAGSPKVEAAIRKAGARDWFSIAPYLPAETRAYVPKVMAMYSKLATT